MDLRRLRGPMVAVISTLLLAGGSVALANGPDGAGDADQDQVQSGDQSDLDADTGVETTEIELDGVQDEVQSGDQSDLDADTGVETTEVDSD